MSNASDSAGGMSDRLALAIFDAIHVATLLFAALHYWPYS